MGPISNRTTRPKGQKRQSLGRWRLTRRRLTLLLLAFALATTADTCTDPDTGTPIPHEHTPAPTPRPTPKPKGPGPPPTCPAGQIPWGALGAWLGCMDDPNAPDEEEEVETGPSPSDRDGSDGTNTKPDPGTYVVESGTTEDGREIVFERPPLCSTVSGNTPCIEGYYEDEEGNEVWKLPPEEGANTEDKVNSVFCGRYGASRDHSGAPIPHIHPAPFPYDHDGNPSTPDICSHDSENCAWHNTCPGPRPVKTPIITLRPNLPPPPPTKESEESKVCVPSWGQTERKRALSALRWESSVPYDDKFSRHYHPEVPGGEVFLTPASTPGRPARHWTALKAASDLDFVDTGEDACLWAATAVGVSLRQLLPYHPSDLKKLRSPGISAAASAARQAAALWTRLSPERQQWYRAAFPRNDPATTWCAPHELPSWTEPAKSVLSLSPEWESRYEKCRWLIPRRGFWEWQLLITYASEQGDHHTAVVASDLSWFRGPTGYLGEQVTLW